MLEVTDDSGFLALVVPPTYESFVSNDWMFDQLLAHFKAQMARRSLLIWTTGSQRNWKVDIVLQPSKVEGFREVTGPILVTGGSVLLTNYESLTMAAQYDDVTLPEKHQTHLLIPVPDGSYTCRIIQMRNPDDDDASGTDSADFMIELHKSVTPCERWETIPWFDQVN